MKLERNWRRAAVQLLPAIASVALLVLALFPRVEPAAARSAATFETWDPRCALILQDADSAATQVLAFGTILSQPLGTPANVAAFTQQISGSQGFASAGRADLVAWDLGGGGAQATNVLLRTGEFGFSGAFPVPAVGFPFDPPWIARVAPHVADPPMGTAALRIYPINSSTSLPVDFDPDGDPSLPPLQLENVFQSAPAVAGTHPVSALRFCGGDDGLQALEVMQAVSDASVQEYTTNSQFLQRFRVPSTCALRWVELAFVIGGQGSGIGPLPSTIAVVDLDGVPDPPPATLPTPLVSAQLNRVTQVQWQSHADFGASVLLRPGHDYGLLLDTQGAFVPGMRAVTGAEGSDWTDGILAFGERANASGDWALRSDRALSFRLIGVPVSALDAPPAAPAAMLQLRAQPNPARGAVMLALQGARGPVPMEVLDARGRRVASGTSSGDRWLWTGTDASGRPLPAGVYFVRARGADGVAVSERVVLVR